MKIHPLHNFVLLKRAEAEHKTVSGIVIPDTVTETRNQGRVIAASAGTKLKNGSLRPLDVKVGDKVLFDKFAGQVLKVEGEELMVMREDEILGVIED